jgi:hypothetical protein
MERKMEFTISKNCPGKYIGDNRYLTSWEKEMIKYINEQIDEETIKQERFSIPRRTVIVVPLVLLDKNYRKKRIDEIEEAYRKNYTLNILAKCGLNIDEFNKTWMGTCSRSDMLLGCVQDKIDGFDYDDEGARIPNHKKMKRNNMIVTYENDVLRITDGNNTYEFKVDEHELIYVNDENVFASSLNPIPTKEEEYEELRRLHEDMEADRIRNDRAMQKSLDFARTFWVK